MTIAVAFVLTSCNLEGEKVKSAYDIAVENGFVGTEAEWLESLKGKDGENLNILDIYNAALESGEYSGDFLSFVNEYFSNANYEGVTAYEIAVANGFKGTEEEWLASLKGEAGADGPKGDSIDLYEVYLKLIELGELNQDECSYLQFIQNYINVTQSSQQSISKAILSAVKIVATNSPLFDSEGNTIQGVKGSSGAGVIYRINKSQGDCYIITNYHVAYDTNLEAPHNYFYVNMIGNQYLSDAVMAKYIGGSATYDIAVLEIKNSELIKTSDAVSAEIYDSNLVVAGTKAIAIGNPQGDGIAVTEGIVSVESEDISMTPTSTDNVTLNENNEVTMRVMRIDTPVNPGNSGGGLFDEKGRLIGIVNAKIIASTVADISYAIPSNIAVNVAENIRRNYNGYTPAKISKCLVGITITVMDSYFQYDPLTSTTRIYEEVVIKEVSSTSPLYNQIQVADIIKSFTLDGVTYDITRNFVILDVCLKASIGSKAQITVLRDNQLYTYDFVFSNSVIVG